MQSNALQSRDQNVLPESRQASKGRTKAKTRTPLQELECRETFDLVDDVAPWTCSDTETMKALQERDESCCIDTDLWPALQPHLNPMMRVVLLDWVMEVSTEFLLKRETTHTAMRLIDEFTQCKQAIAKSDYQLVGVAALLVACKFEEVFVPKLTDLELCTNRAYSVAQIRTMERQLLTQTHWRVLGASHVHWMTWAMSQWDAFSACVGGMQERMFKSATQEGYYLFREAMQVLDALVLDYRQLKLPKNQVVACVLFLVLSKGADLDFLQIYDYWSGQTLGVLVSGVPTVFLYVSSFAGLDLSYTLPRACHVLGQDTLSRHYEEFLSYQTHNPHSQTYVKQLLQCTSN